MSGKIHIRLSKDRGYADHGWLKSYHTFSFADYHDPKFMGFRSLLVINEDRVAPAQGFGSHPHHNMEIISYVIEGAVAHKDSLGTGSVIKPGEVQKMSAGKGVVHSEFNASKTDQAHFLQIWIIPDAKNIMSEYQQVSYARKASDEGLLLIGSRSAKPDCVLIHQDVDLYRGFLKNDGKTSFNVKPSRAVWIQMVKGKLEVNQNMLSAGDGAFTEQAGPLGVTAKEESEFLLFDLG